ncbi:hypothetical protein B0H63DRAFT_518057 [Podospora didyma]|uniref:DUF8212 domain-containing protein n=1 Tax=Podospora didyma TaxID=330526 RepID=A0AAE0U8J5_9PEZI|nr:hypothetical protein B0H63DRAFT_518057 [Podospora didyma]
MRLIDTLTLNLRDVIGEPRPYAILSHTWGEDEVDTCCIDKASSADLSAAIKSMFNWYQSAAVCYIYLCDVDEDGDIHDPDSQFFNSRWFTRGWTLQELIAPEKLEFYQSDWTKIGDKSTMTSLLHEITGIDEVLLEETKCLLRMSVAKRMSWAARRETTRAEDIAYCVMGIFDVNMPMLYGEGPKAIIRLQEEIMKESDDQSLFAWKASAESARIFPLPGIAGLVASRGFPDRKVCINLDCRFDTDSQSIIGIRLVCRGGDQYLRTEPQSLFPCSSDGALATVYVAKSTRTPLLQLLPNWSRQDCFYLRNLPSELSVADVFPASAVFSHGSNILQLGPWTQDKAAIKLVNSWTSDLIVILLWTDYSPSMLTFRALYGVNLASSEAQTDKIISCARRPSEYHQNRAVSFGPDKPTILFKIS